MRQVSAVILVVLFAILVPVTVTAAWAHRTVLNTDEWVSTVGPIAAEPAVTEAVSRQVTDQLYAALDPQQVVADALPPRAEFLAAPITNGTKDYVQQAVNDVISSAQFQTLWLQANRFSHAQLVAVLRGNNEVLQTTGGQVVLNLVPLVNEALRHIQGFASSVVGRQITIPAVSTNELPSAACQRIAAALDRPIPPTCGQVALFPAKNLVEAQRIVRAFDRSVIALVIITPLLAVGALLLSRRRRRTLLQLTIGGMLGLVVVRRATFWFQDQLVASGPPQNKAARTAILDHVLDGFFSITKWLLVAGLVVLILALLSGPYRWAVATRRGAGRIGGGVAHMTAAAASGDVDKTQDVATLAWVRGHFDALRVGGIVAALLLMLFFDVNFWGFVAIAAAVAVYEVLLHRLRPPASISLPPGAPAG